jgi:hypothetical protein
MSSGLDQVLGHTLTDLDGIPACVPILVRLGVCCPVAKSESRA